MRSFLVGKEKGKEEKNIAATTTAAAARRYVNSDIYPGLNLTCTHLRKIGFFVAWHYKWPYLLFHLLRLILDSRRGNARAIAMRIKGPAPRRIPSDKSARFIVNFASTKRNVKRNSVSPLSSPPRCDSLSLSLFLVSFWSSRNPVLLSHRSFFI